MKKALALIGDFYHRAGYIQAGFKSIAGEINAGIEFITDPGSIKWDSLNDYSVFILVKTANVDPEDPGIWMNKDYERTITEYVKTGGSIFVLHSGLPGYQKAKDYRYMVKGHFLHHPEEHQRIIVKPVSEYYGLTNGINAFEIVDEQYFVDCDEKDTHAFLEAESEQFGKCIAGWAHEYGKGKVCCVTPGHTLEVLSQPMMKKVMINALLWCMGQ